MAGAEVAGAVAPAGPLGEEGLFRQVRPPEVAGADAVAENHQLPGLAVGEDRAGLRVLNPALQIGESIADGQGRAPVTELPGDLRRRHQHRGLGGAVGVVDLRAGEAVQHLQAQLLRHHFAAEDKLPGLGQQGLGKLGGLAANFAEGRRGDPQVHARLGQGRKEGLGLVERVLVHGVEGHAPAQGVVEGADRHVEGIGDFIEEDAALSLQVQQGRDPLPEGRDVPGRDLHALGLAGGAGGEEHIDHVLGFHPGLGRGTSGPPENGVQCHAVQHHGGGKAQPPQIHQHLRLDLFENPGHPVGGEGGVHGHIGPASLDAAEHTGRETQLLVAVEDHRRPVVAQGLQQPGRKGVGPGVQLGIGHGFGPVAEGHAAGGCIVAELFENKHGNLPCIWIEQRLGSHLPWRPTARAGKASGNLEARAV